MENLNKDTVEREGRAAIKRGANKMESVVSDAKEYIEDSGVDLQARFRDLQDRSRQAYEYSEKTIKANPMYAVLGAAAIGLVVGALFMRRSSRD